MFASLGTVCDSPRLRSREWAALAGTGKEHLPAYLCTVDGPLRSISYSIWHYVYMCIYRGTLQPSRYLCQYAVDTSRGE